MSFKVKCKLKEHVETKKGLGKDKDGVSVKFVATEMDSEYPRDMLFEWYKNGQYAKYAEEFEEKNPVGSIISVEFNLSARQANDGRWWGKADVWRVETLKSPESDLGDDSDDDLPF